MPLVHHQAERARERTLRALQVLRKIRAAKHAAPLEAKVAASRIACVRLSSKLHSVCSGLVCIKVGSMLEVATTFDVVAVVDLGITPGAWEQGTASAPADTLMTRPDALASVRVNR